MKFFKSERCSICKSHRGDRFCLFKSKDICWHDCNEIRVKGKCPAECSFALSPSNDLQIKTKANSIAEYRDLLTKQMDIWIKQPQKFLAEKTPLEVSFSEEGRNKIVTFLNQFKANKLVPLNYLKQKLKLDKLKVKDQPQNYEQKAEKYLQNIVVQDWQKVAEFQTFSADVKSEFLPEHIRILESQKILKKMKEFDLISSAASKDGKQVLIHLEINNKFDLTLRLVKADDSWLVAEKILGKPQLHNGENEAIQQVALLLSKNEVSKAFDLLKKYSAIYIDSADFEYYWGLYYSFAKNSKKAKTHFLKAMLLDPIFFEAKYNYAYILHTEKNFKKAEQLYKDILTTNPNETKTLNNLASIFIENGNKKEAKTLLERCLKQDPNFELAKKNLEKIE